MKCVQRRYKYNFVFNRKEIIHMPTHYHQFRPTLHVRTFYRRLLVLNMVYFFLYPADLNIIKYNKLRCLTFIMSAKKHQFYDPPAPSIRKNGQQIYCLKTIESTSTQLLLRLSTSIPCGRHKCKVAYRIFHSSCESP